MPKQQPTRDRGYSEREYYQWCLQRLKVNLREIEQGEIVGKDISLLGQMMVPDPKLGTAAAIVEQLKKFVEEHPIEGWAFEFYLVPHRGQATIKCKFYKTTFGD